jgi:hypothetical protein
MANAPPVKKPAIWNMSVQSPDGWERAKSETHNRVVWILLFPDALDGAVERAEETTPDTEIAAQHRSTHLDRGDGAQSPLAIWAVPETLDAVPDGTTDGL